MAQRRKAIHFNRQVAKHAKKNRGIFNTKAQWHKGAKPFIFNRQVAKHAKFNAEDF